MKPALAEQFKRLRVAHPPAVFDDGYSWRFDISGGDRTWVPYKHDLVNAAIEELGSLVLAVSDPPLEADKLRPLGLSVMPASPLLCHLDHEVDFEALHKAAWLDIGGYHLFHPRAEDSVGRFLAARGGPGWLETLIRTGITDFVIEAELDDVAWTVGIDPALQPPSWAAEVRLRKDSRPCLLIPPCRDWAFPLNPIALVQASGPRDRLVKDSVDGLILDPEGTVRRILAVRIIGSLGTTLWARMKSRLASAWEISVELSEPLELPVAELKELLIPIIESGRYDEELDAAGKARVAAAVGAASSRGDVMSALALPVLEDCLDQL